MVADKIRSCVRISTPSDVNYQSSVKSMLNNIQMLQKCSWFLVGVYTPVHTTQAFPYVDL